jgi:predicted nucleotidyltransferase
VFDRVLDRFVTACQMDALIVAAFLGGSYARGTADQYSDLDLYVITTDEDFNDVCNQRKAFVQQLGEPVFLEDFDLPNTLFFILAGDIEGELGFGRVGQFSDIHTGPYKVLVDKLGILRGVVFPRREADTTEQRENLRRLIYYFWHDLSHFITAMGRGRLWWAMGQLEALRRCCTGLARLRNDFSEVETGEEVYFKLEQAVPLEQLAALKTTFCPLEAEAMLQAGMDILRFYKELAAPLAETHGMRYPEELERIMIHRLDKLRRGKVRFDLS